MATIYFTGKNARNTLIDDPLIDREMPDIMVAADDDVSRLKANYPNVDIIGRTSFYSFCGRSGLVDVKLYSDVLHIILNDFRVLYLSERTWRRKNILPPSMFEYSANVEAVVYAAIYRVRELDIRYAFMNSFPHGATTFIFFRVAELMGVSAAYARVTAAPWRFEACVGLDEPSTLNLGTDTGSKRNCDLLLAVNRYLSSLTSRREDLGDLTVQRKQRELAKGDGPSWQVARQRSLEVISKYGFSRKGLKGAASSISLNHYRRKRAFSAYSSLASGVAVRSNRSIVVFLHFQPESSSMPEGGIYAQQIMMVRSLSLALPSDWNILVREHPATFRGPGAFSPAHRSPEFYRALAALPGVELTPMSTPPALLLEHASCVATIVGTVGLEALSLGVPVIAFGSRAWSGAPSVLKVGPARRAEIGDIEGFLASIDDRSRDLSVESVRDFVYCSASGGWGPVDFADWTPDVAVEAIYSLAKDWLAWAKSGNDTASVKSNVPTEARVLGV